MFDRTRIISVSNNMVGDAGSLTNKIIPTNCNTKSWVDHAAG